MKTVLGRYSKAKIFSDQVDGAAVNQVVDLCNSEASAGSEIRVMPDVHAEAGGVIGTTMTIRDRVVPGLVGMDIGCGVECAQLRAKRLDLRRLDALVREQVPVGAALRVNAHSYIWETRLSALRHKVDMEKARLGMGTLGGGNHFIEAGMDTKGNLYLLVHTGSRHMGREISEHYQTLAAARHFRKQMAASGGATPKINKALAWLEGDDLADYLNDMKIAQDYADLNRRAIMETLLAGLGLVAEFGFSTVHNYVDTKAMILRKGAVSARNGERLLITTNMRDGCLVCLGRGNAEWNQSAPHGSGRLMTRAEARRTFTLAEYKKEMEAVYSTTLNEATLDECPMAYRSMEEIRGMVEPTVDVIGIIRPMYSFKAAAEEP